jgi:hypothetical protein
VVVDQRPRLAWSRGQGDELGIGHRRLPSLGQCSRRPLRAQITRLTTKPDEPSARRLEYRLNPQPIRLNRLRLLHPITRNVRRIVEPRQQTPIRRDKHLHLTNTGLRPSKVNAPCAARKLRRRPHY